MEIILDVIHDTYIDSLRIKYGLKQPLSGGGCMLVFMLLMTVAFSFMLF